MSFTYTGIDRGHSAPRALRKSAASALLKSKVGDETKNELSGPRAMSPPQPGVLARRSPRGAAALPLPPGKLWGCAALRPGGAARLSPALPRPPDPPPLLTGAPRGVREWRPGPALPPGRAAQSSGCHTHAHTGAATREDEEEPAPRPPPAPRNWTWHNEHSSRSGPPVPPPAGTGPSCAGRPRSLGRTGDTRLSPAPDAPSPCRPPRPTQVCGGP